MHEATEVIPFLADALGVKEAEDRSWIDGIVTLIGSGQALLLLDNLEQVVAAAAEIAVLVERCPGLSDPRHEPHAAPPARGAATTRSPRSACPP